MAIEQELQLHITRRQFFGRSAKGIGVVALASLLAPESLFGQASAIDPKTGGLIGVPHFPAKAKRVIYLYQGGAPSQVELFDYKPRLHEFNGADLPESVRNNDAGATAGRTSYKVVAPIFKFQQAGKSGTWISELLPYTAKVVDDLTIIRTLNTKSVAHEPAMTYTQTGFPVPGRPSMGAWVMYGLGSLNHNLPTFVVLVSQANALGAVPNVPAARLWSAGFMPSKYQGVKFGASAEPVFDLSDPPGVSRGLERQGLDTLSKLNEMAYQAYGDPEIETRIAQYEMAYQMQTSVPELMDFSKEPDSVFEM